MSPLPRRMSQVAVAAAVMAFGGAAVAAPHGAPVHDATWTVVAAAGQHGTEQPANEQQAAQRQARVVLDRPVDVFVLKQDLAPVVQSLAEQAGIRVTLGKGLSRPVSNLHLKGTAAEALDQLAETIGAVWWWSGTDVRLVDRSDLVTKTLKTRDFDRTLAAAKSLGIPVDLITMQKADGPGIVRMTGPSGLVTEVESLVKDVTEQDGKIHVTRYGRRRSVTAR
jgi:hypothetical protein